MPNLTSGKIQIPNSALSTESALDHRLQKDTFGKKKTLQNFLATMIHVAYKQ